MRHLLLPFNKKLSQRRSPAGFTLVEIVISILLAAVMIASLFSVTLSVAVSGGSADRKIVAGLAQRQLNSQLASANNAYWDYSANGWSTCPNNALPCNLEITGPFACKPGLPPSSMCSWDWGYTMSGSNSYVLDDCGNGTFANCSSGAGSTCYAMSAGASGTMQHTLYNYLPAWFEAAPYCARISYTVSSANGATTPGGPSPQVSINVLWQEPTQ